MSQLQPISPGIRFNIIGIDMKVSPGGLSMSINHELFKADVPYSEISMQVHLAQLKYGEANVMLEPARLYTAEQFGFRF